MSLFTYYARVYSHEHMLFCKEIAELYNILDKSGKPSHTKVGKIIKSYISENNINYCSLYYETRNGLREVFPKEIYENAIIYAKMKGSL